MTQMRRVRADRGGGAGRSVIDMFLPSLPTIAAVFGAEPATAQLTVTCS
jgi:hypothetical protein